MTGKSQTLKIIPHSGKRFKEETWNAKAASEVL
jgi:hypothetical protein